MTSCSNEKSLTALTCDDSLSVIRTKHMFMIMFTINLLGSISDYGAIRAGDCACSIDCNRCIHML